MVSREHHKDEGLHLHAVLITEQKMITRDARFFDFDDALGRHFHPHVGHTRDIPNAIAYARKEGHEENIFEFGVPPSRFMKPDLRQKRITEYNNIVQKGLLTTVK